MNETGIDCLIIGCGLSGSVIARTLAEKYGKRVLVWERRDHIGGNMFDYVDEHGILVHKYGPHSFHTNNKSLYDYICRFGDWKPYYLTCMAQIDGKNTLTPFNFSTNDTYFAHKKGEKIKRQLLCCYPNRKKIAIVELLQNPDELIKEYANFLFEKDYKPYTDKQWGILPSQLDVSIFERVPVYLSYVSTYYDDLYQFMPAISYSNYFQKLLDHPNIHVELGIDANEHIKIHSSCNELFIDGIICKKLVVYTGALDELFAGAEGVLPYRSLFFEWKHDKIDSFQDAPVVVYPQADGYTRITEYNKIPLQKVNGTTYAVEYPIPYDIKNNEPYYPILTEKGQLQYKTYKKWQMK
jgi:UDP-galactopyranose mutase